LISGFVIVAIIAGIIGGIGIYKILQIKEIAAEMYTKDTVPLGTLVQLGINSQKARVNLRGMMLDTDQERMAANADGLKKRYEDVEKLLAEFEKNVTSEDGRKEITQIKSLVSGYKPIWEEIVNLQLSGKREDALEKCAAVP
jgi:methyl-accepting chemotaxis protein